MYRTPLNNWCWRDRFRVGVFVVAVIVTATAALGAQGVNDQTSVAQRIYNLKAFIDDDNVVLFHNDLMDSQHEALNANSDAKELAQFIIDIWEQNQSSLPDLNWENAKKDEFRVSIAAIITLGIRDGWINYDQEEINQYFRKRVTAHNSHVATLAILYLAVGGNDDDAALFRKLSLSKAKPLAHKGIRALGMLCSPAGEEALKQLVSEMSDTDSRALAAETLKLYYGDGPVLRCYK